mmetsp:Transcript_7232/g.14836  ORF Transcript_7232/g.14836 Transcript_7232/m.14836 type:complete len:438 (-) Transcript_7232:881-2194(-)
MLRVFDERAGVVRLESRQVEHRNAVAAAAAALGSVVGDNCLREDHDVGEFQGPVKDPRKDPARSSVVELGVGGEGIVVVVANNNTILLLLVFRGLPRSLLLHQGFPRRLDVACFFAEDHKMLLHGGIVRKKDESGVGKLGRSGFFFFWFCRCCCCCWFCCCRRRRGCSFVFVVVFLRQLVFGPGTKGSIEDEPQHQLVLVSAPSVPPQGRKVSGPSGVPDDHHPAVHQHLSLLVLGRHQRRLGRQLEVGLGSHRIRGRGVAAVVLVLLGVVAAASLAAAVVRRDALKRRGGKIGIGVQKEKGVGPAVLVSFWQRLRRRGPRRGRIVFVVVARQHVHQDQKGHWLVEMHRVCGLFRCAPKAEGGLHRFVFPPVEIGLAKVSDPGVHGTIRLIGVGGLVEGGPEYFGPVHVLEAVEDDQQGRSGIVSVAVVFVVVVAGG